MGTKAPLTDIESNVGAAVIAELLDCSEDSVHRYVKTLGLPCVQMGNRSRRFLVSEVLAWRDRKRTTFAVVAEAVGEMPVKRRPGRPAARPTGAWADELRAIGREKK